MPGPHDCASRAKFLPAQRGRVSPYLFLLYNRQHDGVAMSRLTRVLTATVLCTAPIFSQTITASLEGDVRDVSGAVVPAARVQVVNTDTGVVTRLTTGPDGRFIAPSLPPGPYSVMVEATGFKKAERTGIVLQVNQTARMEVTMEVGAITETVEIRAEAPLLESSSSALGQVIENRSIINLVFKSGTNQLHGSAYEFLRNSRFDANGYFANQRGLPLTNFKRNQFGVSAGGPVYLPKIYNGHNRTFFFVSYEGLRERSQSNLTTTVPTELQRNGDFSRTVSSAGAAITIYDPATTTRSGAAFIRQAFPGNLIPATRIDPVARNVMKYYPLPNRAPDNPAGTNNLALPGTAPTNSNSFDIKGDENINDRNRFFVRVSHRNYDLGIANRFPADIAIAQGDSYQPQISNNAAFDYTFNLRATYLLDFRYGFGRTLLKFSPRSAGFDPTSLGLPSYIRGNADGLYFPTFAPSGYLTLGGTSFFRRNAFETHNWSLNNSKVMTGHLLKFGFEVRLVRVN